MGKKGDKEAMENVTKKERDYWYSLKKRRGVKCECVGERVGK